MTGEYLFGLLGVVAALGFGFVAVAASDALRTRTRIKRRLQPFTELLGIEEPGRQVAAAPVEVGDDGNPALAWLNGRFPLAGGVRVTVIVILSAVAGFAATAPLLVFVGMTPVLAVPAAVAVAVGLGLNVGSAMENGQAQ